jgi:hypothetical protein
MRELIIGFSLVLAFSGVFWLARRFLVNLEPRSNSYYDFGKYFPNMGRYIILLYIGMLLLVGVAFAVFAKVDFKFLPA